MVAGSRCSVVSGKTKTLLDLHICPARALTTAAGNPAEK
jgi:hypothetical protein